MIVVWGFWWQYVIKLPYPRRKEVLNTIEFTKFESRITADSFCHCHYKSQVLTHLMVDTVYGWNNRNIRMCTMVKEKIHNKKITLHVTSSYLNMHCYPINGFYAKKTFVNICMLLINCIVMRLWSIFSSLYIESLMNERQRIANNGNNDGH